MKRNLFAIALAALCAAALLVMAWPAQAGAGEPDVKEHVFDSFKFEVGASLRNVKLVYATHGSLNADKSNAILVPSYYSGDHNGQNFLIGEGKGFDPSRYFIITTDMFANGLSSSPSNTPAPAHGADFPQVSIRDNVEATYRLVTERLGIRHLVAVAGYSMGAQQAFQWAVSHPDFMDAIIVWCGTAKTYPHGVARLAGFRAALTADAAFRDGRYEKPPLVGLKAGARHWAPWGFSQEWWRREIYKALNHPTVEAHLTEFWEAYFLARDANNLHSQAVTWQHHDVGQTPGFGGNVEAALKSIRARVLYIPGRTDLYFPIGDADYEAQFLRHVELKPIPSIWGHLAGIGFNPDDNAFLNRTIAEFLASLQRNGNR